MKDCLRKACNSQQGNIAYFFQNVCFSVTCAKLHSCDLEASENSGVKTYGALYRIIGKNMVDI